MILHIHGIFCTDVLQKRHILKYIQGYFSEWINPIRFIEYLKLESCLFYLLLPSRSKDEEIELVTLDDFYKTAPADISRPVSFSLLSKLLNFVSCALERLAFIFRIILLFLLCRIYLLISEQNYIF